MVGKGGAQGGFLRNCGSAFNKIMSGFNNALKYDTPKVCRVIDRRLGLMNYFFQLIILGYLALAVYLGGAYMVEEHTAGMVIAKVSGESYSRDQHKQVRFWDYGDAQYPPVETGAIFLATRVLRTNMQTVQLCANPLHKCSGDDDEEPADTKKTAGSRRLMMDERSEVDQRRVIQESSPSAMLEADPGDTIEVQAFTPKRTMDGAAQGRVLLSKDLVHEIADEEASLGEGSQLGAPTPPPTKKDSKLDPAAGAVADPKCSGEDMPKKPYGTGKCSADGTGCLEHIWCPPEGTSDLKTLDMEVEDLSAFTVEFQAHISYYGLMDEGAPLKHVIEKMTLAELIDKVGAEQSKVKQSGAIISVMVWWDCNLESVDTLSQCQPKVSYQRLDEESPGFSWRRAAYFYTAEGERARDVQRMVGIRIKMSTFGYGRQPHLLQLILQLSIGLTLLGFANTFTDFLMLNVFEDAALYYAYKVEESADFGDLRERLQNLDGERQLLLLHEKRRREAVQKKGKKRR